jgi:hypothetical protein
MCVESGVRFSEAAAIPTLINKVVLRSRSPAPEQASERR